MPEEKRLLEFLKNAVPGGTPVTVASQIYILESLGVVSNKKAVEAMKVASLLVTPDAQVTFRGLMNLLTQLIMMNPKFGARHQGAMDSALSAARGMDDFPLTFGTLIPICEKLLEAKGKP